MFGVTVVCAWALVTPARVGGPELQSGEYKTAEMGSLQQAAPRELAPDSAFSVAAYPVYAPPLAEGEGKQETEAYCSLCHSARYISMQPPMPAASWEAEGNKMNKTFGANIPEAVAAKILKYLQAHYTPETRKQ